jgi:hypothetical protein
MDWNQLTENESLETKRQLSSSNKLAIEVIAFANTRGGRIVIGYDEKAKVFVGVVPSQKLEEKIANIIHDCCEPQVTFAVSYESVQDKPLMIIDIPVSANKPHYLKSKGLAQGTYVRVGSTCRLADQETLARLIREGKHISFDSETVSRSSSLSQGKIQRFLEDFDSKVFIFSPAVSVQELIEKKSEQRKIPMSWGNKPGSNKKEHPMIKPGEKYDHNTLRKACQRACTRAGVDTFTPYDLRRSLATRTRANLGKEAAKVLLGHTSTVTTDIYLLDEVQEAMKVAKALGDFC